MTLANLGNAYGYLGNVKKQKELLERVLTIQKRHFSPDHPHTKLIENSLAKIELRARMSSPSGVAGTFFTTSENRAGTSFDYQDTRKEDDNRNTSCCIA